MDSLTVHRQYVADLYGDSGEYRNSEGRGVSKTMFYTQYLKDLGISPLADDQGRAYITHEQKSLLDEYHRRRSESRQAVIEFLAELKGDVSGGSEVTETPPAWVQFAEAIAASLSPPPASDPLLPQEQLQRLCDRGWQASTAQIAQIIGTKTLRDGTERYGFRFIRSGRVGREAGWRVERVS